jgi:hypothetical protein
MESSFVGLRAMVGRVLGLLGVVLAVLGIFIFEGISIEYVGLILGGLGYYFGLTSQDRMGQILGIIAVALNVVSIGISGLEGPLQ